MKLRKLLFILLIIYSIDGFAQTNFTLADCIDYTLKNHPTLKIHTNNLAISDEKSKQNLAGYLPQVNGSVNITDNLSLQSSIVTSEFIGPDPVVLTLGSQFTSTAYVDITQRLIDPAQWAKIRANTASETKSIFELQQNEENIIYNTSTSFFQILIYQEQLNILNANREKYEEISKVMEYQLEKGTLLAKDLSRIKVNLNSVNYQMQDAETKLKLAYNTLKNAMGMALDKPLSIDTSSDHQQYLQTPTEDLNLENLIDYKLSENAVGIEKMNLKVEKADLYPTLSAVGRFGYQSLTNEFSEIYSEWNDFSYIGLSLNIPIFSGAKQRSKVNEGKLILENQLANFEINKEKLQLNYENAKASMGTAHSNYLSNKDNMALAKEVLGATKYQYERGVATLTDYLNDDTAFKSAQSDYLNSFYNLLISLLNYHKSEGTMNYFISQMNL